MSWSHDQANLPLQWVKVETWVATRRIIHLHCSTLRALSKTKFTGTLHALSRLKKLMSLCVREFGRIEEA